MVAPTSASELLHTAQEVLVLLSGKTKSHAAYVESVEIADAVRGVKRVSSEAVLEPSK